MLTDNDVLGAFGKKLSPGEVSATLRRLLRVPEAWNKLHEPDFLENALAPGDLRGLTPSELALLSLGLAEAPAVEHMPDPLEDRLAHAWRAACTAPPPNPDLETTALLALGLCRKAATEGAAKVATLVLSSPDSWRSALACAWPWMPEPRVLRERRPSARRFHPPRRTQHRRNRQTAPGCQPCHESTGRAHSPPDRRVGIG